MKISSGSVTLSSTNSAGKKVDAPSHLLKSGDDKNYTQERVNKIINIEGDVNQSKETDIQDNEIVIDGTDVALRGFLIKNGDIGPNVPVSDDTDS